MSLPSRLVACLSIAVLIGLGSYVAFHPTLLGKSDFKLTDPSIAVRLEWWCCQAQGQAYSKLSITSKPGLGVTASGWPELVSSRASFYADLDESIMVLTPLAGLIAFKQDQNGSFAVKHSEEESGRGSSDWRYLGAVDGSVSNPSNFKFYPPSQQRECIPMLGLKLEVRTAYRLEHQSAQDCDMSETSFLPTNR
ncbi:MAG: hypothetical protein LCH80_10625 [Proteobacteria bacterium]|nr:hypothetical protein [Pseudomonadota bacterium]